MTPRPNSTLGLNLGQPLSDGPDGFAEALLWLTPVLDALPQPAALFAVGHAQPLVVNAAARTLGSAALRWSHFAVGEGLCLSLAVADTLDERLALCSAAWQLTERQRRALSAVVSGATNKEIATVLDVSVSMVEQHLRAVFRKAGVDQRGALIAAFWAPKWT